MATGRRYIGQTRQDPQVRLAQHRSEARTKQTSTHFHRSLRKYGREAFVLTVLQDGLNTLDATNAAERQWIEHFHSTDPERGFNLEPGGDARATSAETRMRQSLAQKRRFSRPGAKGALAKSLRGRVLSPEHRKKLSQARQGKQPTKGQKRRPLSEDHKSKISKARQAQRSYPRGWPVQQIDLNGKVVAEYSSMLAAARAVGTCGGNTIARCVAGKQTTAGGFRWRRLKPLESTDTPV